MLRTARDASGSCEIREERLEHVLNDSTAQEPREALHLVTCGGWPPGRCFGATDHFGPVVGLFVAHQPRAHATPRPG